MAAGECLVHFHFVSGETLAWSPFVRNREVFDDLHRRLLEASDNRMAAFKKAVVVSCRHRPADDTGIFADLADVTVTVDGAAHEALVSRQMRCIGLYMHTPTCTGTLMDPALDFGANATAARDFLFVVVDGSSLYQGGEIYVNGTAPRPRAEKPAFATFYATHITAKSLADTTQGLTLATRMVLVFADV